MSTLRYRVISPSGIHIGTDFYDTNEIVILTERGAKYLLINKQIALASEQAPVGVPDGPSEDDVEIDIHVNNKEKTVSLTELRDLFPRVQGPEGSLGPQGRPGPKGDKGDKGDVGHGIALKGAVASYLELPAHANDGDVYLDQGTGHGLAWSDGNWIDIGQFKGPKGDPGESGDPSYAVQTEQNAAAAASSALQAAQSAEGIFEAEVAAQASASAAANSESNARSHKDAAATSESNAASSASVASTSATSASNSASGAATSASHAATSEANAATSESNALASKNAAATSATNAATSESNALASKNAAATSAATAATSESNALTSKNDSATSASNAATSESNALSSKNAAAISESNAATSESNAATSASNAHTSELNAATSASNAASAVQAAAGTALPVGDDGAGAVGTGTKWAREDHKHPTDTSRAPVDSPNFTGTPTAPTPTAGDNSTKVATTAFVMANAGGVPATAAPLADGTATVGVSTKYAREDHVHPTDSSRAPVNSPGFTGSPTAPTPTAGDNSTKLATTSFVATAVSNLVGSAPGTLDTLNELAAALGNDANFSTTISAALGNRLRVDTNAQGLTGTQQTNAQTNLGLGNAATRNVGTTAGTVSAGDDSRFTNGAFSTLTVAGSAVWHAGNFNPASYAPAASPTFSGAIVTGAVSSPMTADSTASIQVRNNGGSGDGALAMISFLAQGAYGIKMGVRADGYFGLGGWSRAAWSWYSAPNSDMVAGGNITAYSDPELKDDVSPIADAIDIIRQLDGVRFTWNHKTRLIGRPGERDVGVLADQVEAVLPEIVGRSIPDDENDGKQWRTVAYDKLVPVLIEGIKAQQDVIERQQTQLDALLGWARSNGFPG